VFALIFGLFATVATVALVFTWTPHVRFEITCFQAAMATLATICGVIAYIQSHRNGVP
jgi:hypothetical protein